MGKSRLLEKYNKEIAPLMKEKFGFKNIMAVPMIEKVVLNVGMSRAIKDENLKERIENDITKIAGQKPKNTKAKKSISGFKVREGMDVGLTVTLRKKRMYDFVDRLVSVALPRTRDFKGIELKNFDSRGNLNIGIKEQNIFPEIEFESSKDLFSLQITITTTAKNKEQGVELLKLFGFPLKLN